MKWTTWTNLIVGIGLIVSPWAVGYSASHVAMASNLIAGVVLVACSGWILAEFDHAEWCGWLQVICGIWLVVAPVALRYHVLPPAFGNDVIIGVVVFVVSLIETATFAHFPVGTPQH